MTQNAITEKTMTQKTMTQKPKIMRSLRKQFERQIWAQHEAVVKECYFAMEENPVGAGPLARKTRDFLRKKKSGVEAAEQLKIVKFIKKYMYSKSQKRIKRKLHRKYPKVIGLDKLVEELSVRVPTKNKVREFVRNVLINQIIGSETLMFVMGKMNAHFGCEMNEHEEVKKIVGEALQRQYMESICESGCLEKELVKVGPFKRPGTKSDIVVVGEKQVEEEILVEEEKVVVQSMAVVKEVVFRVVNEMVYNVCQLVEEREVNELVVVEEQQVEEKVVKEVVFRVVNEMVYNVCQLVEEREVNELVVVEEKVVEEEQVVEEELLCVICSDPCDDSEKYYDMMCCGVMVHSECLYTQSMDGEEGANCIKCREEIDYEMYEEEQVEEKVVVEAVVNELVEVVEEDEIQVESVVEAVVNEEQQVVEEKRVEEEIQVEEIVMGVVNELVDSVCQIKEAKENCSMVIAELGSVKKYRAIKEDLDSCAYRRQGEVDMMIRSQLFYRNRRNHMCLLDRYSFYIAAKKRWHREKQWSEDIYMNLERTGGAIRLLNPIHKEILKLVAVIEPVGVELNRLLDMVCQQETVQLYESVVMELVDSVCVDQEISYPVLCKCASSCRWRQVEVAIKRTTEERATVEWVVNELVESVAVVEERTTVEEVVNELVDNVCQERVVNELEERATVEWVVNELVDSVCQVTEAKENYSKVIAELGRENDTFKQFKIQQVVKMKQICEDAKCLIAELGVKKLVEKPLVKEMCDLCCAPAVQECVEGEHYFCYACISELSECVICESEPKPYLPESRGTSELWEQIRSRPSLKCVPKKQRMSRCFWKNVSKSCKHDEECEIMPNDEHRCNVDDKTLAIFDAPEIKRRRDEKVKYWDEQWNLALLQRAQISRQAAEVALRKQVEPEKEEYDVVCEGKFEYLIPKKVVAVRKQEAFASSDWDEIRRKQQFFGNPVLPRRVEAISERKIESGLTLTFFTPMQVREGDQVDLTNLVELSPILRNYMARANFPFGTSAFGFIVFFAEGPHPASTKLVGRTQAIGEVVAIIDTNAEKYDMSRVTSIQLKTLKSGGAFFGGLITAEKTKKWVRVKYASKSNCVLMALVLGVAKNNNSCALIETDKAKKRDTGISSKREVPILTAPKQIWQKRMNNYKRRKLIPMLLEKGHQMPVGPNREDIAMLADLMEIYVAEYNGVYDLKGHYGNPENPLINIMLDKSHCELLVERELMSEEEIDNIEKPEKSTFVMKTQREDSYGDIMAADIETFCEDESKENFAWAIGSQTVDGEECYKYGADCLEKWFEYLALTTPRWKDPEWVAKQSIEMQDKISVMSDTNQKYRKERNRLSMKYIYFHNGKNFDFFFIRNKLIESDILQIIPDREIAQGSRMMTFAAENRLGMTFIFRDSYLVIKGSLAQLTTDMDVNHKKLKGTVDFEKVNDFVNDHGFSNETIGELMEKYPLEKYLKHDVKGLLEVLLIFAEIALEEGVDITKCPSQTSVAKRIFTTNYMKHKIENLTDEVDLFVSPAVLGGDCGSYYLGEYKGEAYFYDITSEYPSVCMTNRENDGLLPCRVRGSFITREFELKTVEDYDREFWSRYDYFIEVEALSVGEDPNPFHMLKKNLGKTALNVKPKLVDWTAMTRYSDEIRYGLETGLYNYRVKKYLTFEKEPVFDEYMTKTTDGKKKAKKEKKKGVELFFKLNANGLTGAPGMKVKGRASCKLYNKCEASHIESVALQGRLVDFNQVSENYVSVNQVEDLHKTFFNRALYAAITAKGRIMKDRFERKTRACGGKVLYGDTDSVVVTIDCAKLPEFKHEFSNPGEIGGWENELPGLHDCYTHSFFGGNKSYYLFNENLPRGTKSNRVKNPKIAQRGYKGKPTLKDFRNFMKNQTLTEIHEGMQFKGGVKVALNGFHLCCVTSGRKTFALQCKKGVVGPDGWLVPWELRKGLLRAPEGIEVGRKIEGKGAKQKVDANKLKWEACEIVMDCVAHTELPTESLQEILEYRYIILHEYEACVWEFLEKQYKGISLKEMFEKKQFYLELWKKVGRPELPKPSDEELKKAIFEIMKGLTVHENTVRNIRSLLRIQFCLEGRKNFIKDTARVLVGELSEEKNEQIDKIREFKLKDEVVTIGSNPYISRPTPNCPKMTFIEPYPYVDKRHESFNFPHLQVVGKAGWGPLIYDSVIQCYLFRDDKACQGYGDSMNWKFYFKYTDLLFGVVPDADYWEERKDGVKKQHFHEWLHPDRPIKPVFDIDEKDCNESIVGNFKKKILPWIVKRWQEVWGQVLGKEEIVLVDSSGKQYIEGDENLKPSGWKNSWHVYINNGSYFMNMNDMKRWWGVFQTKSMPSTIDRGLYQRWRSFRLSGSTKEMDKCGRLAVGPLFYLTDFKGLEWQALDCCDFPEVSESYYEVKCKVTISKSVKEIAGERGWEIVKRLFKYETADKEVYKLDTKTVTCPFAKRVHNDAWQRLELYRDGKVVYRCKNKDSICDHQAEVVGNAQPVKPVKTRCFEKGIFFKSNLKNSGERDVRQYQLFSNFWPEVKDAEIVAKIYGIPAKHVLFSIKGRDWDSVERYFQVMKFEHIGDSEYAKKVYYANTVLEAKKMGGKGVYFNYKYKGWNGTKKQLKEAIAETFFTWGEVSIKIMREALNMKFDRIKNPELVKALLSTKGEELHEHEISLGGSFWGMSPKSGRGGDNLGKLLDSIREISS